ncbi:hypothetical protein IZ6_17070 [Terrihabitans soli]|uniref:Uncharacterized protein n=1 Tax=Terrihabitans soli TaxID=708113 RepID=A0A6S6QUQ0_9HYPH|nr:hypothetical protein [Terrihabitans soli]BCJ90972.1 hypothetical protein IZ6_17070 [Terrihabitans soli]
MAVTHGGEQTLLALKKLGALFLLLAGLGSLAIGFNGGYTGLIVLGFCLIAGSILLLILKVIRRNSLS